MRFLNILLLLAFTMHPYAVNALVIEIDGVRINDNGPNDRNKRDADTIEFISNAPAPLGFPLPRNSSVSEVQGTVKLVGSGATVSGLGGAPNIINLTDFIAVARAGAGTGALTISFEHPFPGPPAPARALDAIDGNLNRGTNLSLSNDRISWQAFINGVPISPPAGAIIVTTPASPGVRGPVPVIGIHGNPLVAVPAAAGGPPWTLKGVLEISLSLPDTNFSLRDSAEIGISGESPPLVPTVSKWSPLSIFLLTLIIVTVIIIWRRNKKRA